MYVDDTSQEYLQYRSVHESRMEKQKLDACVTGWKGLNGQSPLTSPMVYRQTDIES
jgi:hypothetical protein